MSKTPGKTPRTPRRILESYTIKGSDGVIRPGDSVLMKAPDSSKPPYVVKIEEIEAAGHRGTNVKVKVRWYYRPEESIGGRRPFHGEKEVFLSDHQDVQSADTIECKCNVYSFRDYTKLAAVNPEDYFCRFEYKSITGSFVPDRIAVFCKCEMPYNPDDLMIQCAECSDWSGSKKQELNSKKKLEKKLSFYTKVKDVVTSLHAKKAISKKKKQRSRQKKLKAYDLSALSEFLPQTAGSQQQTEVKLNRKSKQALMQRESAQLNAVLNNPQFQLDPFAAIHQHLVSTQPPSSVKDDESAKNGKKSREDKKRKKKKKKKKKKKNNALSTSQSMDI